MGLEQSAVADLREFERSITREISECSCNAQNDGEYEEDRIWKMKHVFTRLPSTAHKHNIAPGDGQVFVFAKTMWQLLLALSENDDITQFQDGHYKRSYSAMRVKLAQDQENAKIEKLSVSLSATALEQHLSDWDVEYFGRSERW